VALFTLYRITESGALVVKPLSEHRSPAAGFTAGQDAVHADSTSAFALYQGDRRVSRFGFSRLPASLGKFESIVAEMML